MELRSWLQIMIKGFFGRFRIFWMNVFNLALGYIPWILWEGSRVNTTKSLRRLTLRNHRLRLKDKYWNCRDLNKKLLKQIIKDNVVL